MLRSELTKSWKSVKKNQIRGYEVRLDQVSKQYSQLSEQVHQPSLILADEPTGNLDSKTGNQMLFILKENTEDLGVTVIMVTHDPMVAAYGHELITLKDGRILDSVTR